MKRINLSIPNVCGNEVKYVSETLADGWISAVGPYVNKFEEVVANYAKVEKTVAVASGSAGLHLSYLEAGVKQGDIVVCPALTFIASINPIAYTKAEPYFIDVDDTLCISPDAFEIFLNEQCYMDEYNTYLKETNQIVRAIVAVDIFGNLCDFDRICEIAHKAHIVVIEDAAEAVGTYQIKKDGTTQYAGTFGDFGVYSFNGNKIISTGGGGIVFAKDLNKLEHIRHVSTQAKSNAWYFYHDEVGYNYRLSNTAGAIGVAQMEQLEAFVAHKHEMYDLYKEEFKKIGLEMASFREDIRSNKWFYSLLWDESCGVTRDDLMLKLKERGIETRPIWGLIHEQKPYMECRHDALDKTNEYYKKVVNIPCSTNLTREEALYVVEQIKKIKLGE